VGGERVVTGACNTVTVTEIVASVVRAAKSMSMEGVSRCAVSAQCMTTPPMTKVGPATMGGKSMKPTASAMTASTVKSGEPMEPTASTTMKATTASTVKAATASATMPTPTTAMPGDC